MGKAHKWTHLKPRCKPRRVADTLVPKGVHGRASQIVQTAMTMRVLLKSPHWSTSGARCDICVAVLSGGLGPHQVVCLSELAGLLPGLRVVQVGSHRHRYPWRFTLDDFPLRSRTLCAGRALEDISIRSQWSLTKKALDDMSPSVVVVASIIEPAAQAAAHWAWSRRVPIVLRWASTYSDRPRTWLRETIKRQMVGRYNVIAATGARADEYVRRLTFGRARIRRVGNVVDNEHFMIQAEHIRSNQSRARTQLKLPTRYFLAVSRLVEKKNLVVLLKAYKEYRDHGGDWELVIVGSGPLHTHLTAIVQVDCIPDVHFVGWVQYDALPAYYTLASCLVLASTSEPWGLVVNEAMACGLPVLVSECCGCLPELCHAGRNGYHFPPGSHGCLVDLMIRVSADGGHLATLGRNSQEIVAPFSPRSWAQEMGACVRAASESK